jgi:hypothetical protein
VVYRFFIEFQRNVEFVARQRGQKQTATNEIRKGFILEFLAVSYPVERKLYNGARLQWYIVFKNDFESENVFPFSDFAVVFLRVFADFFKGVNVVIFVAGEQNVESELAHFFFKRAFLRAGGKNKNKRYNRDKRYLFHKTISC